MTAAFDPIDAIADRCESDIWLCRRGLRGRHASLSHATPTALGGADLVWNLHKMAGLTQQCTALLIATSADYLFNPIGQRRSR